MKTILTEWGPMSLNDWRRIMLKAAHICATKARMASGLTLFCLVLFPTLVTALTVDSFYCLFTNHPLSGFGSSLIAVLTIWIGQRIVCSFRDIRVKYMLARQALVDEVAAKMRTFK